MYLVAVVAGGLWREKRGCRQVPSAASSSISNFTHGSEYYRFSYMLFYFNLTAWHGECESPVRLSHLHLISIPTQQTGDCKIPGLNVPLISVTRNMLLRD